ncbi:MAG: PAS domain-containing sensor histidine kinase, partial [Silvanigrellaceae bacterium]|nr:PAS domain-containing sensor histidine kinase [Silvanigrellaceae bacterium]
AVSYAMSLIEREMQIVGGVLEFRDITQEKQSQEEVRIANEKMERSLSQLEAILENMSEGLAIFDTSRKLIRMNSVALAIHGYKDNNSVIADFNNLDKLFILQDLEGNLIDQEELPISKALRGEKFSGYELKVSCLSTEKNFVASFGGALAKSKSGEVILAFITIRDITDQKHAEQVLKNAVEARDTFMSVASHELKTPLTSLKLQAQMRNRRLEKQDPSLMNIETFKKMFETDTRQVERLTRLVDDMLDISRLNTGKLILDFETFDLCTLTLELLERFMPEFTLAECEVSIEHNVESLVGRWDVYRIEQVISNLLTNAMRYGAKKPIKIVLRKANNFAIVDIIDQGIGISPDDQQRIFQQFERAVSAHGVSGLGLGLYIVSQIVKAHGGFVDLKSELGEGSTFSLKLPLNIPSVEKL